MPLATVIQPCHCKVIMFIALWFSQLFNLGGENGVHWVIVFGGCGIEALPPEEGQLHSTVVPSQSPGSWVTVV